MKKFLILVVTMFTMTAALMVVNAATVDNNPPTLRSISIKNPKSSYKVGDKVYLNLNANDDVSGLYAVNVYLGFTLGSSEIDMDVEAEVYDIESNPYFIVPKLTDNQTEKAIIFAVGLSDYAGNNVMYFNDKNAGEGLLEHHVK